MKKIALSTLLLFFAVSGFAQPRMSVVEAARQADSLLSKMTLDEKISMTRGYSRFFFNGIERLGIPLHLPFGRFAGREHAPQPARPHDGSAARKVHRLPVPDHAGRHVQSGAGLRLRPIHRRGVPCGRRRGTARPRTEHLPQFAVRPQFRVFRRGSVSHVAHHRELRAGNAEYRHGRLPETLPGQQHGILPPPFELDSRRTHDA